MIGGRRRTPARLLCAGFLLVIAATGCSTARGEISGNSRVVRVGAAENFWGSVASQLGGKHAQVSSIITNPNTDPHSYEPTAADARTIASARLVIENGAGYDPWVSRLVAADQGQQIAVLNVASALGVLAGGNPHRWYNPDDVRALVNMLAARYSKLDPTDKNYFARRRAQFLKVGLGKYDDLIASIKDNYGGT